MFGAQTENVAFTANCTHALNMAIKGIMQYGGHMIISDHEHNAVARPVYALSKTRGVKYSIARTGETDSETVENFRRLITPKLSVSAVQWLQTSQAGSCHTVN